MIRILGRGCAPFWQDESYDHLVRNDPEFARVQHYIEINPVTAGLVLLPEEFPWSSATRSAEHTPGTSPAAACAQHGQNLIG